MGTYTDFYAEMRDKEGKWKYGGLYLKTKEGKMKPAPLMTGRNYMTMLFQDLEDEDIAIQVEKEELSEELQKMMSEYTYCFTISEKDLYLYASEKGNVSGWVLDSKMNSENLNYGDFIRDEELSRKSKAVQDIIKGHRHYRYWLDPESGLWLAKKLVEGLESVKSGYHWERWDEGEYRVAVLKSW